MRTEAARGGGDYAKAVTLARRWLRRVQPSGQDRDLQRLGLWLCDSVLRGRAALPIDRRAKAPRIAPRSLVALPRHRLLAVCRLLSLAPGFDTAEGVDAARWFGGLALSYARVNDVAVVAALVRTAARLNGRHPWLDEAERYLLAQQQPEGSFGFLAPEMKALALGRRRGNVTLRLSVEVLWALAEVRARGVSRLESAR